MSGAARAESTSQLLQLAAFTDETSRRDFLACNPSLFRPEVVAELTELVREQVRVDVQQALNLADAAILMARELDHKESLARALRAKANALYAGGENAAAVDLHQQAVALFEAIGETTEVARTLSGSIQPLLLMGQYDRALSVSERARAIFTAEGNSWRLARLEINVGNIHYRRDRFAEALACWERAYQGMAGQRDAEGTAAILSNMATCYISLNDFPRALQTYQQARQFCEQHAMPLLVAQADYNIAYLHFLRGEYSKAIQMLRATHASCQKIGDAYHGALCNLDLAELYLELNLSSEAAELAQQGYRGFQKLGMGYESAKCLAFSAIAGVQLGDTVQSLELFSRAREIFVREKNQAWSSLIDLYRALVFCEEGRWSEARRLCTEALEAFRLLRLCSKIVLARLLLARIAVRTGTSEEALKQATTAIEELNGIETPSLLYQARLTLGNVLAADRNLDRAYSSFQAARQALETLRGSLRGEELKISFVKNRLEVYENLVEICLGFGGASPTEEAFTYVEQAKSRSLMDLFLKPAPTIEESDPEGNPLGQPIRELRDQLNWYYSLIEREQLQPEACSQERIAALQQQAKQCEKEMLRALQDASEADTDHAGLQTPSHMPLAMVRAAIPRDTLIVEYFRIRDRILVWLVGRETLETVSLAPESRVAPLLRLLQFQLSKFRFDPKYIQAFLPDLKRATEAHLKELHAELIAPIAGRLSATHLVFVPHGLLHYVPFHALFDGRQYLIDRYTVSYAPSASIYALCQARTAKSTGPPLVLGIPDQQAPAIAEEVRALADVLDGPDLFLGPAASAEVLRSKGAHSRMIHIATHGHFRQDSPLFSCIRMGDSFLSLYDLYQLRLPAELITLSGCSTGLNVVAAGDELIGLARGLLHAGAESLVLSLWDVHDKSTAEYMTILYRFLGEGKSKPAAMQAAMIELRSRYPHPYQWAPFILVGKS